MARKTYSILDEISPSAVSDQDVIGLIAAVREGLGYPLFMAIAGNTPFSLGEWSSFLHLSERTLQRYKKEKKKFDALQSEKILQIAILYKQGVEAFGGREKFDAWLESESLALGRMKPKDLLDSNFGIGLLRDEIIRIEHGVLA
jgi:putative toxin-antitoxin system antitoxin component (TIGR02293 family)